MKEQILDLSIRVGEDDLKMTVYLQDGVYTSEVVKE